MSNTISIIARLAQDPELRFAASGTAMCNLSIPDQKRKKNDAGQWEDASATTWFRVTLFGDAAEAMAEHGRKGDTVVATGRLITREWTNQQGEVKSSLELDYATVGIVPSAPKAQRAPQQSQGDPWAAQSAASASWGTPANSEPPF